MTKWVALTARRLKPGSYDAWRQAWETGDTPEGVKAYICRNVNDPDEIVAFGIVEMSKEEIESHRGGDDSGRQQAMAPHVESVGIDGFYEVIEEVTF